MVMERVSEGLQVAERVAWEFIKGLGVEPDRLEHRSLGTMEEMLRQQHNLDLVFVDGFPAQSSRYYEACLQPDRLPKPFREGTDHSIISYETAGRRYPVAFMYRDLVRYGDRKRRRWMSYELLQRRHTTQRHRDVICAMADFGTLSGRNACDASIFLPASVDAQMRVLFPGVYPPNTYDSRALIAQALSCMEADPRVPRDANVLVLGSGSGVDAIALAKELGVHVDCVDVNPLAVANTRANALLEGAAHLITAWTSDCFDAVKSRYDYILFNAPLPVDGESDQINTCDAGGRVLTRVLERVGDVLCAGGSLYLMNRWDISYYVPSQLRAQRVFDFARVALSIHRISVK